MKVSVSIPGWWVLLFIIFLVLKLTEIISWSWWWVCSPLWIPFVILLFLILIGKASIERTY